MSSTAISVFFERFIEIWREILGDVHLRAVGRIHVADLETRGDELISLLQFAFRRIVQLGDAIGGVASFPTERIIDVEKDLVTRTDIELLENVCSLLLGKVDGRPVGSPQKKR